MKARPLRIDPLTRPPDADVVVPGSKSITNRALITAALATGTSRLDGVLYAEDTLAMIDCVRGLGADVSTDEDARTVTITGTGGRLVGDGVTLDVRQSGTTARFILPLAAMASGGAVVDGDPQMRARPQTDLVDALESLSARIESLDVRDSMPLRTQESPLRGDVVRVPGDVSSQFVSALLLAAPAMADGLTVELTGEVVSAPYITMTVAVMEAFGATVEVTDGRLFAVAGGGYVATDYAIEPDASAASYFFAAAAVSGGRVGIDGLGSESLQGDLGFVRVLESMGAEVEQTATRTEVSGTGLLGGVTVDLRDLSDTAPTLAAIAPLAGGPVTATGIGFIRRKESDRIAAVVTELRRLGVEATDDGDGFTVTPGPVTPATVSTYDDHRLAMAFTVMGLVVPGIEIADAQCVAKTFVDYFDVVDVLRSAGDRELAILAIDGPAGSGKSTVARLAAERLDLEYLDTGAMYRSVTLAALDRGVALDDLPSVGTLARHVEIDVGLDAVTVDDQDVTAEIRSERVNDAVSVIAANPSVRAAMRRQQRAWARRRGGGVMEGRDIGSVVFPQARLKVYVTASIEERARRRAHESGASIEEVVANLRERDRLDSSRSDSPLTEATDATTVDTTGLTIDEVVDRVVELFGDAAGADA